MQNDLIELLSKNAYMYTYSCWLLHRWHPYTQNVMITCLKSLQHIVGVENEPT